MHVSWLMIKCERIGRMESDVKWRPVPAVAFNNDTVTYLIVSKQALPVPASIAEVLDVMEGWGKSYDIVWYNRVVAYMGYLLCNGFELSREFIVQHAIEFKVNMMAQDSSAGVPYNIVIEDFALWFEETYLYSSNRQFYELCRRAISHVNCVLTEVEALLPMVNTSVVVPVLPPSTVSSSSTASCVSMDSPVHN